MIMNNGNKRIIRTIAIVLVTIYIFLLAPVLFLGQYDYHCADDFGFSAASHIAWEDTHSLSAVFKAAGETVVDRWHTWQGTFTTMFLMALEPGLFGDSYYHLVPWIMIGAMTVSTMYILYILLVEVVGCDKTTWISVSMIYLIVALECIVDPLQGFFWYNGAVHYMIPHSIAIFFIALLMKLRISRRKVMLCVLISVISFLLGGSNYITALGIGVVLVYAIIIDLFLKLKKNMWMNIVPMLFFTPAFMINVLAPGNSVRQAMISYHPSPIKAIMLSFYYCIERALGDWLDWKIVAFMLACCPFSIVVANIIKERKKFKFQQPMMVVIFSFCFLSSLFAPSAYSAGDAGGGRVENIIYLDYVLILFLNEVYIIGWLDLRLQLFEKINSVNLNNKKNLMFLICFCVGVLFCAGLSVLRDKNCFTTSSAIESIISGEASRYGDEIKERSIQINNCEGEVLIVPRFIETPYLLYMDDIVPESDDWRNNSMENYYRIKEVIAVSE